MSHCLIDVQAVASVFKSMTLRGIEQAKGQ